MTEELYKEIVNHFSNTKAEPLTITHTYDLTHEENYVVLEADSHDASQAAKDLGLNYDISAYHYAKTVGGDELHNYVDIEWSFWK